MALHTFKNDTFFGCEKLGMPQKLSSNPVVFPFVQFVMLNGRSYMIADVVIAWYTCATCPSTYVTWKAIAIAMQSNFVRGELILEAFLLFT